MTIDIRLVKPSEYDAVDQLVQRAYEFDYGPREHGDDPIRFAANRSQVGEVWVAVEQRIQTIDPLLGSGTGAGSDGIVHTERLVGTTTVTQPGGTSLMEDVCDNELDFRLLAVDPDARRRGIAKLLVAHTIDLARQRGKRGVFLKSAPNMTGAHRLYESLGFRRAPERDGLRRGGEVVFDLYAFAIDVQGDPDRLDPVPQERELA